MNKFRWLLLSIAVLFSVVFGYKLMFRGGFQFGGFPPAPVIVNVAEQHDFTDIIDAIGTAKSNESVEITSTVTDTINKINFDEGQYVKKGKVLVELSTTEAKATLEEAEKQFKRLESLTQSAAATLSRYDEQLLALQVAQSRYADKMIEAPFSGYIGLRRVSEGALVSPGTMITTLDDISTIKVDFFLPEKFMGTISPGKKIVASSVAYPGKVFEGSVYVVDTRVDPATRSFAVKAKIPNEEMMLKPGMLLQVKTIVSQDRVILLPEEAIRSQKENKFVYLVDGENKVQQKPITIGRRVAGKIEIVSGVDQGDKIVMEGSPLLMPGQAVNVVGTKTIAESEQEYYNLL